MRYVLIVFLVVACSGEQKPTAPSGKAVDFGSMFDVFNAISSQSPSTGRASFKTPIGSRIEFLRSRRIFFDYLRRICLNMLKKHATYLVKELTI